MGPLAGGVSSATISRMAMSIATAGLLRAALGPGFETAPLMDSDCDAVLGSAVEARGFTGQAFQQQLYMNMVMQQQNQHNRTTASVSQPESGGPVRLFRDPQRNVQIVDPWIVPIENIKDAVVDLQKRTSVLTATGFEQPPSGLSQAERNAYREVHTTVASKTRIENPTFMQITLQDLGTKYRWTEAASLLHAGWSVDELTSRDRAVISNWPLSAAEYEAFLRQSGDNVELLRGFRVDGALLKRLLAVSHTDVQSQRQMWSLFHSACHLGRGGQFVAALTPKSGSTTAMRAVDAWRLCIWDAAEGTRGTPAGHDLDELARIYEADSVAAKVYFDDLVSSPGPVVPVNTFATIASHHARLEDAAVKAMVARAKKQAYLAAGVNTLKQLYEAETALCRSALGKDSQGRDVVDESRFDRDKSDELCKKMLKALTAFDRTRSSLAELRSYAPPATGIAPFDSFMTSSAAEQLRFLSQYAAPGFADSAAAKAFLSIPRTQVSMK